MAPLVVAVLEVVAQQAGPMGHSMSGCRLAPICGSCTKMRVQLMSIFQVSRVIQIVCP
jgi:hypothetical protein